jgi:hypothetical protein
MLFAFAKRASSGQSFPTTDSQIRPEKKYSDLIIEIGIFRNAMKAFGEIVKYLPNRKIGYGAAHMLATFNYHTDGSVERLEIILDDDNSKSGMSYKNIQVSIRHPEEILIDEDVIFVPTSLENQRRIIRKISEDFPNKVVIVPVF